MNAKILARLAALDLPMNAFKEVLSILADMQSEHESVFAAIHDRRRKDRERKARKDDTPQLPLEDVPSVGQFSTEIPRNDGPISAENPADLKERKPPTPPKKEIYTTLRDHPREEPDKPLISPQAFEITEAIGAEARYTPQNWPPGWCGAAFQVQMFLNEGYDPGIIRAACTSVLRRGRGPPEHFGYFRKAIVDMRSRLEAPLPQVKPRQLEVIDGGRSDARTGLGSQCGRIVAGRAVGRAYGSVLDAAEDFREECAREAERRGEGPYRPNLVDWRTGEPRDGGLSSG